MTKMIVGLGNPGRDYERTRHNAGFWTVDQLAHSMGLVWGKSRLTAALVAEGFHSDEKVLLVKPQTYMNLSGRAVKALVDDFHIRPEDIIVIYDDLDLPEKSLRIRQKGSSGGHRGVASIIQHLATDAFGRVKIGVGRPPLGMTAADYVLQRIPAGEMKKWEDAIVQAAEAVKTILAEGYPAAMNRYNGR